MQHIKNSSEQGKQEALSVNLNLLERVPIILSLLFLSSCSFDSSKQGAVLPQVTRAKREAVIIEDEKTSNPEDISTYTKVGTVIPSYCGSNFENCTIGLEDGNPMTVTGYYDGYDSLRVVRKNHGIKAVIEALKDYKTLSVSCAHEDSDYKPKTAHWMFRGKGCSGGFFVEPSLKNPNHIFFVHNKKVFIAKIQEGMIIKVANYIEPNGAYAGSSQYTKNLESYYQSTKNTLK
jgi:hypothetical protein